jgi:hypothetical protein
MYSGTLLPQFRRNMTFSYFPEDGNIIFVRIPTYQIITRTRVRNFRVAKLSNIVNYNIYHVIYPIHEYVGAVVCKMWVANVFVVAGGKLSA